MSSLLLLWAALFLLACETKTPFKSLHFSGNTMGTTYNITVVTRRDAELPHDLADSIEQWLEVVNQSMSTFIDDSELAQLNQAPVEEWQPVSSMMAEVLAEAENISELSGGAFDVTVAPLVDLWGFGPVETDNQVPSGEALEDVRERVGHEYLELRLEPPALKKTRDVQLDLSAIAKGFGADYVGRQLRALDLENYLVELGGDLLVHGHNQAGEPWLIGVEKPSFGRAGVQQAIAIGEGGVATSGDYRNFFQHDGQIYSHILDPRLGRPVKRDLISVTVVAESGARADGLATAFTVMGADEALKVAERENIAVYLILREDGEFVTRQSGAFEAYLDEG